MLSKNLTYFNNPPTFKNSPTSFSSKRRNSVIARLQRNRKRLVQNLNASAIKLSSLPAELTDSEPLPSLTTRVTDSHSLCSSCASKSCLSRSCCGSLSQKEFSDCSSTDSRSKLLSEERELARYSAVDLLFEL